MHFNYILILTLGTPLYTTLHANTNEDDLDDCKVESQLNCGSGVSRGGGRLAAARASLASEKRGLLVVTGLG